MSCIHIQLVAGGHGKRPSVLLRGAGASGAGRLVGRQPGWPEPQGVHVHGSARCSSSAGCCARGKVRGGDRVDQLCRLSSVTWTCHQDPLVRFSLK